MPIKNRFLRENLKCTITEKDSILNLINIISNKKMKSGRPSIDNRLLITCNNKSFLLKLTGNQKVAKFLESNIKLPIKFEVVSNNKGFVKHYHHNDMLISINTNEWIVDQNKLTKMLDGFKLVVDHIC